MPPQASTVTDKSNRRIAKYGGEGADDFISRSSFEDVKAASLNSIDMIVGKYLSDAKLADNGKEWTARNPTRHDEKPGSFKINRRTGVWSEFATGEKGADMIDLVAYLTGKSNVEAKNELAAMLSVKPSAGSRSLTGNIPVTSSKAGREDRCGAGNDQRSTCCITAAHAAGQRRQTQVHHRCKFGTAPIQQ